jgi:hypothetical protein
MHFYNFSSRTIRKRRLCVRPTGNKHKNNIITWCLKAGIVKSGKTAIVRQQLVETRSRYNGELKHISSVTLKIDLWPRHFHEYELAVYIRSRVGGVEYLHRSPASRRRRRKGKSRICDSKLWSRVPWNSGPRMTALARTSNNCKRQTCPLVRKSAPHQLTRNWQ